MHNVLIVFRETIFDRGALYTIVIILFALALLLGCGLRARRSFKAAARPLEASDSALEARFRLAILDKGARESLMQDALRKTGGDRVAAIRRVMDDLHGDNERWS
jgi:hypothetical protein